MQSPEHLTQQLSESARAKCSERVKLAEQLLADVQQASPDRISRYVSDARLPQVLVSMLQTSVYPKCHYTTSGQVQVAYI